MKPILEYDYWYHFDEIIYPCNCNGDGDKCPTDPICPNCKKEIEGIQVGYTGEWEFRLEEKLGDFMYDFGKLIKSMSLNDIISVDGIPKKMNLKKDTLGWDWLDQVFGGGYSGWNYNNVKNIEVYKTKNGIDVVLGNREPCKIRKVESK